jgi:hypothetical protein
VLRAAEAGTPEALEAARAPALDSITPADARGRFNQCGYRFPTQAKIALASTLALFSEKTT